MTYPRPDSLVSTEWLAAHLQAPDVRERLASQGAEPIGNTPDEFTAQMKRDLAKWSKVVKDAAIKLDDDYVSTRHARIAASGDEWFVEDLGSTNGTYVGPVRITQPTTIGLGVQVRVGKTILELRK